MNFEELIDTLSKGSATAVTTLESNVAELNALKEYLYVQTPVEQALRAEIDRNLKTPRVIFVCGSSGDGKSELFRRIHADYAKKVGFHLDATHSFDPQKDAIQTLDDQQTAGVSFTAKQQQWLEANKDPISSRLAIDSEDFAEIPIHQLGGLSRAYECSSICRPRFWKN